jgi:hypothetical protein
MYRYRPNKLKVVGGVQHDWMLPDLAALEYKNGGDDDFISVENEHKSGGTDEEALPSCIIIGEGEPITGAVESHKPTSHRLSSRTASTADKRLIDMFSAIDSRLHGTSHDARSTRVIHDNTTHEASVAQSTYAVEPQMHDSPISRFLE